MLNFREEPITELPKTLDIIRQMLDFSATYLSGLEGMDKDPAAFNKSLIDRILKVSDDLKIVMEVFSLFCQNWKQETLTQDQQSQLAEVESGLSELEKLHEQIMFLAKHLPEKYKALNLQPH